jgi:hypothetical protein
MSGDMLHHIIRWNVEIGERLRIEVRPQFTHGLRLPKQLRIALPPAG